VGPYDGYIYEISIAKAGKGLCTVTYCLAKKENKSGSLECGTQLSKTKFGTYQVSSRECRTISPGHFAGQSFRIGSATAAAMSGLKGSAK